VNHPSNFLVLAIIKAMVPASGYPIDFIVAWRIKEVAVWRYMHQVKDVCIVLAIRADWLKTNNYHGGYSLLREISCLQTRNACNAGAVARNGGGARKVLLKTSSRG